MVLLHEMMSYIVIMKLVRSVFGFSTTDVAIVQQVIRRVRRDRQTLMRGYERLHLLLVRKPVTANAALWQSCNSHRTKKTSTQANDSSNLNMTN